MTDPRTGLTRGYGFVRFGTQLDQHQAMNEMQGFVIGNRPIRVSLATPKNNNNSLECFSPTTAVSSIIMPQPQQNTTVFVGGLSCPLQEDELKQYFSIFGDIVYVKIPPGKGCGFVQFVSRKSAEMAIDQMNGYQIGSSRIRLSWGRSQNQPTVQQQQPIIQQQQQQQQQDLQFIKQDIMSSPMITYQQHPFDEDRGFMTVFENHHFTSDTSSFFINTANSTTTSTRAPDLKSTALWSSDYHIFAQ